MSGLTKSGDGRGKRMEQYAERIEQLRGWAEEDGFPLNDASLEDFRSFAGSGFVRKAGLVLLDNGNLRAAWRDGGGNQVGVQFRGGGSVEYVVLKRPGKSGENVSAAGSDTLDGIRKRIGDFGLETLVFESGTGPSEKSANP